MTGNVPAVMVSSTFYDLREIRQQLAGFLERDLGYRALISEASDFPVDPDADAIENCRRRVEQNADVLVLVIGARYGYVEPASGRSVTNLEYLGARAKGIPIYAFIDKRTLTLFEAWSGAAEDMRSALSGTVETGLLFEFIRDVRAADAVWMFGFESAADIVSTLRTQLAYYAHSSWELSRRIKRHPDQEVLSTLAGRAFRLALEKPEAWEYRLFAHALADELDSLRDMRRDYDLGIAFGAGEYVTEADFGRWVQVKIGEILRLVATAGRLVNETLQEAFGPPGQPGDAGHIVFVARRLGRVYREAMEWWFAIRRVHPESEDFRELLDALANYSREIVVKLGQWAATLGRDLEAALRDASTLAPGERRTLSFTLTFEEAGSEELLVAMRTVYARRGLAFD